MFDVQRFIREKQRQVKSDRSRSQLLRIFSELLRWVVLPVFIYTSIANGLMLTAESHRLDPLGIAILMQKIGYSLSELAAQCLGDAFWSILIWACPHPRFTQPVPWLQMAGWAITLYGLIGLSIAARYRSKKLSSRADRTEERLEDSYANLMHIQELQESQRNRVGDVIGHANIIRQGNTIRNIFREDVNENTFNKYLISIAIGVAVNLISKLMHIS